MRVLGRGVLLACTLAACGHNLHYLQRASARAIIPTPHPDSVKISDIHGSIGLPRRWVATTHGGVYDCSIEAGEQQPICSKRKQPAADSLIRLPLRVHLLEASGVELITTTRTPAAIDTLVAVANGVWAQAGIQWYLESVFREAAPEGGVLEQMIAGTIRRSREALVSIAPTGRLLRPGWNLFMIRDFGPIGGGVFYSEISGILLAERGYGYELPPAGRGGTTLAHELGHSLGLFHVACDSTRNIMANACGEPGQLRSLTAQQIATARTQARLGQPSSERFERRGTQLRLSTGD